LGEIEVGTLGWLKGNREKKRERISVLTSSSSTLMSCWEQDDNWAGSGKLVLNKTRAGKGRNPFPWIDCYKAREGRE